MIFARQRQETTRRAERATTCTMRLNSGLTMLLRSFGIASAIVTVASAQQQDRRSAAEGKKFGVDVSNLQGDLQNLDAIWESEINLAQLEAERALAKYMSVPPTPRPSRAPTPGMNTKSPTRPPATERPTPAQGPTTPSPTSVTPPPTGLNSPSPVPTTAPTAPTDQPASAGPTVSPDSCLDGQTRTEYIENLILENNVTTSEELSNPATPQGLAFVWITVDDPLFPNVCAYPTILQRYALATFYYSTNGQEWIANTGWLGDTVECEWFGVICDNGVLVSTLSLRK